MKIKIKHKMFFTLLLTSVVASLALHFYVHVTFKRGFTEYVKEKEMEQLEQLSERLAGLYSQEADWGFMDENHRLWQGLHTNVSSALPPLPGAGRQGDRKPPPGPPGKRDSDLRPDRPGSMGPRIILYDAEKNWIIGGAGEDKSEQEFIPIVLENSTVGYLGLIPGKKLGIARDRLFIEKQVKMFALVPIIVVVLSLLLSYPITVHLLRPINAMIEGTGKLIAGRFATRIPVTTSDELGKLSGDFNELASTLEKNEQNRKQWVADISHELRTPLSVLRGEIEALQDGIRTANKETLDGLHGEVMHLERMVGDLYELSMSDIGALSYRKIEVDPVGIVQGTVELFERRYSEKGISVTTNLDQAASCTLRADPDRLQQLFSNILENSLRYTDEGGEMELTIAVKQDEVAITVEDSAPTVPEEQLQRLFDRFYRVDSSRSRNTGGAGLGLAICKNIVEGHGGRISAAASLKGGVVIEVALPLVV